MQRGESGLYVMAGKTVLNPGCSWAKVVERTDLKKKKKKKYEGCPMGPRLERAGRKENSWRMGEVERVGLIKTKSFRHRGCGSQRGLMLFYRALSQRTT